MLVTGILLSLVAAIRAAAAAPAGGGNPFLGAANNENVRLTARGKTWDYQNDKVRGVNLGGWLVLEAYITPSIFSGWRKPGDDSDVPVDEYHLCQKLGNEACLLAMTQHWKLWYTEEDFAGMKQAGLNFVRIPVGYWAFHLKKDDPYVQGQQEYLDQGLRWAQKYGLMAWIDLHGAPGSQNGFDNSGFRDKIEFQQQENFDLTLTVFDTIFDKYTRPEWADVVAGIQLLNEPLGPLIDMNKLKKLYYEGYNKLRARSRSMNMAIHDAFQPTNYWDNDFKVDAGYYGVVLDHHHYQVFSGGELRRSIDEHVDVACKWGRDAKTESHWTVCGEWLAALTDCAFWLNGVGRGARWLGDYDHTLFIESCAPYWTINNFTDQHKQDTRRYVEAQMDAFDQTGGWIFWNWKCENADEWDFKRLASQGLFPQPLDERKFGNQCKF